MPLNFPSTPADGQVYFDAERAWIYRSALGKWDISRFMPVEISATAPSGQEGKLWFDSNDGTLMIYLGSAWVQVSSYTVPADVLAASDISVTVQEFCNALRASDLNVAVGRRPTLGTAQASTSGTSIDFNSLPTGIRQIEISFAGLSTNGASEKVFRLGSSAGIVSTGYVGVYGVYGATNGSNAETSGLRMRSANAADVSHGIATMSLVDPTNHIWHMELLSNNSNNANTQTSSSRITLPGELDRVRLTTLNGTDAFDAGLVNIRYQ